MIVDRSRGAALLALFSWVIVALSCSKKPDGTTEGSTSSASASASVEIEPEPIDVTPGDAPSASASSEEPEVIPNGRCPKEMLLIQGRYCIDRWEAHLVDRQSGSPLSPYYPPDRRLALRLHDQWDRDRLTVGGPKAQAMPVPALPLFQQERDVEFMAVSKPNTTPSGYLTGHNARKACERAGKRLCKATEWVNACQGPSHQMFPYGNEYKPNQCNIFRPKHPAAELHNDASRGHLDPRLNLVTDGGDPLLRKTGATKTCVSKWGDEGLFDMNGNLDEWVEDPKGRFLGGFFSRGKKDGCLSSVGSHPNDYFDYSTGVRCCADPKP